MGIAARIGRFPGRLPGRAELHVGVDLDQREVDPEGVEAEDAVPAADRNGVGPATVGGAARDLDLGPVLADEDVVLEARDRAVEFRFSPRP